MDTPELDNSASAGFVGPTGVGTCGNVEISQAEPVATGVIWYTDSRVVGVGLGYSDGPLVIGSAGSSTSQISFAADNAFVGFYGLANTSQINALGFLVHDPECSAEKSSPSTG